MRYLVGASSDIGKVRQGNEDSYLLEDPLFVVADGMGGHLAGDVASQTAIEVISEKYKQGPSRSDEDLARMITAANSTIWDKAKSDPSLSGMGTTVTLLKLEGAVARLAHVGDSRAYHLHEGELSQVTEDHTLVQRMVREGKLRPEEAERHPQRSIITRALGVDSKVQVDSQQLEVRSGDRILLCSDGLSSMLSHEDIRTAMSSSGDAQSVADDLVQRANDAGGEDNITVVVIEVIEGGESDAVVPASDRAETSHHVRVSTDPDPMPPGEDPASRPDDVVIVQDPPKPARGRSVLRRVLASLLVLALLGGIGFAVVRYVVTHSWFVGLSSDNQVTIYEGIPEEVLGLSFREPLEESTTALGDLPEFIRDDVEAGIKVDSLDAARAKVADLEDRAAEFRDFTERTQRKKN